ncbi:MAG: RagB/SusD family nutrient uptake outer membrane protein [Bacteroides sp.]|nr:RagB/SusD family nutrient uptake outer membrane protein [Bacteroides sp.]
MACIEPPKGILPEPAPIPEPELPEDFIVSGKAENTPFLKGTTVSLQELDESYLPTGRVFTTTVHSDEGDFSFEKLSLISPYVIVSVNGYYFDQVRNIFSSGQLTLHTIADLRKQKILYINPISHLKKGRIQQLVSKENLSFAQADTQAQKEVLNQFGLQLYSNTALQTTSVTDGTNEAAVLVVISSTLLQGVQETASLGQYLTTLEEEMKREGRFSEEQRVTCRKNSMMTRWEEVESNLRNYYKDRQEEITFKKFNDFVDWDGDGIAGNEKENQRQLLSFGSQRLDVGKQGGTYTFHIVAWGDYEKITEDQEGGYGGWQNAVHHMEFSTSLDKETGELIVKVGAAINWWVEPAEIIIRSTESDIADTLVIHQRGLSPEDGHISYDWGEGSILYFLDYCQAVELSYVHGIEEGRLPPDYREFYDRSTSLVDNQVLSTALYQARSALFDFNSKRNLIEFYYERAKVLQSAFSALEALVYYQMFSLWGKGLYVYNELFPWYPTQYIPIDADELWDMFIPLLLEAGKVLPVEGGDHILPSTRDMVTATLARVWMWQQQYSQSLALLEEIIQSRRYSLGRSWENIYYANSKELIVSFDTYTGMSDNSRLFPDAEKVPAITYGEILLCAAECASKLGQADKAWDYMNQVRRARGRSAVSSGEFMSVLADTWREDVKGTASFLPFLRRNGLAEQMLSIESYQVLLPFSRGYTEGYGVKQNPGW